MLNRAFVILIFGLSAISANAESTYPVGRMAPPNSLSPSTARPQTKAKSLTDSDERAALPESTKQKGENVEYVVQTGDTLSKILNRYFSGRIYGKEHGLALLLEMNPQIKKADTIFLGQKIVIPNPNPPVAVISNPPAESSNSAAPPESIQPKKIVVYVNYRFNYITAADPTGTLEYNFNTDYDLEGGLGFYKTITRGHSLEFLIGSDEFSVNQATLAPGLSVGAVKQSHLTASFGYRYEFLETNSLALKIAYRPYYFLLLGKLENEPAPAALLEFENHFYNEHHNTFGFSLVGEAIVGQDYSSHGYKSENGTSALFSLLYRQEFAGKDRLGINFYFRQRLQDSTYFKMKDKNTGINFSYSVEF